VRRVIYIESKGNPRVISKGNFGLMQIRLGTARSMGYTGSAEGLLDADTNMTYAVKYLATAYRAAGCIEQRAIAYYQRGFYKRPASNCGPRAVPAVVQVAAKEHAPAAENKAELAAAERVSAPFDALRPKIVQVQTIVRPKTFNVPAQSVQTQSARSASVQSPSVQPPSAPPNAQPSAPVQSASLQLTTAPAAPAAEPKSTDVTQPPVWPAERSEAAPPQTVAKAPDTEQAWPPALTPEPPAVVMLPMPKPRPAKAPKAFAKLDVTDQDTTKQDAVVSDVATAMEQAPPDATQLATVMLPMPKPRPAQAPKVLAKLNVTSQDTARQDAVASDVAAATEQASSDATQPATLMLPMPQPRPAKAPKALANIEMTGQGNATKQDAAASEVVATPEQAPAELSQPAEASAMQQMAKLDPQAVPLPQRRPEIEQKSEHQGKSARRAPPRHVHYRSPKPETPALIAFFQKLTTPPPPQPTRRRSW
jgi:hypothetical protein